MRGKPRIQVLGLDGGSWGILESLMARGIMPHLERLRSKSCHGALLSTIPPYSAPAWASFMTGRNPGKTGIFSLTKRTCKGETVPVTGADIQSETFWDYAGKHEYTSTVMNVPMTYPPKALKGALVSGLFTPSGSRQFAYPESLVGKIAARFPDYHPAPFSNVEKSVEFVKKMIGFTELSEEIEEWIVSELDPHIRIQVLQATDILQHFFLDYITGNYAGSPEKSIEDALIEFYRLIDRIIGKRMEIIDRGGVFILISDHGFSRLSRVFHINRWLEQKGYLKRRGQGPIRRLIQQTGVTRKNIVSIVRKMDFFNIINRIGLNKQWALGMKLDSLLGGEIDWTQTNAFCGELSEEGIYLNRKTRFEHGILESETGIEQLSQHLKHELETDLTGSGPASVLRSVYLKSDIYHGPETGNAPEILLDPSPDCLIDAKFSATRMIENTDPKAATGRHERHGIALFAGSMFQTGKLSGSISIIDVAPIILYCLGLQIPEDIDGSVPEDIIKSEYLDNHPVSFAPDKDTPHQAGSLTDKEKQDLMDRLKGLGYL